MARSLKEKWSLVKGFRRKEISREGWLLAKVVFRQECLCCVEMSVQYRGEEGDDKEEDE